MPRYALGTINGHDGDLYAVEDHADNDAAVASYKTMIAESHPDICLAAPGDFDNDGCDFVVRVADGFPLDATSIGEDDIEEWIKTFKHAALEDAGA